MNKILKNFSYTLISNVVSFLISTLITFVVPKRLGVESYSYFQLYIFYVNYTGFLHFGWADGVFLRYGGEYYENLNRERFSGQFKLYCMLELVFSLSVSILGYYCSPTWEKSIVFSLIGISIILLLPKTFLQYILQGTNRIREYATLVVLEKIVYLSVVILALISGTSSFSLIIAADLLGKLCALIYAIYQCRDIVFSKSESIQDSLHEVRENIRVGVKLMFATLASMLIIGIVRWAIEHQWDVTTFGKVSLTMSVSNLLMLLIRAVALIMFPLLRRTNIEKLSEIYKKLRTCIMIPLFGLLIFYYPMKVILSAWLPKYAESLKYMALLFPMCIFESKMSMLIETYMKTLRKEKLLLIVNMTTVMLSVVLTSITVFFLENLDLAVLSIVVLLAFRCVFAEILLSFSLDIHVVKDICLEVVLTSLFISVSWFVGGINGLEIYIVFYFIYLVIKAKDIKYLLSAAEKLRY